MSDVKVMSPAKYAELVDLAARLRGVVDELRQKSICLHEAPWGFDAGYKKALLIAADRIEAALVPPTDNDRPPNPSSSAGAPA